MWLQKLASNSHKFFVGTLSVLVFLGFFIGSYDFFKNVESNKCEMTWMFEYPQYVQIKLGNDVDRKYPMYGLYAYAEGKHTEAARDLRFQGIPVLFIPGNAGSYKQVRSFASVALRKWLDNRTPFHFDFFSLDLNEEISGLYGYVLFSQSEYAHHAVERIISLYEDFKTVVVIGHSMGGIVAKSIAVDNPHINLVYTLASPQLNPVLIPDPELDLFYYQLMKNWTQATMEDGIKPATLLSIAGGDRDFMVSAKSSRWDFNDVHAVTTGVPSVWASTDHLCIVWCKQFVFAIVRSLFDLVEYKQKSKMYVISENAPLTRSVLQYHFVKRSSGKSVATAHPQDLPISPPSADWNELLLRELCVSPSKRTTFLMYPMLAMSSRIRDDEDSYVVTIVTSNTAAKNWIMGCKGQDISGDVRYCSSTENLAHLGEIFPNYHRGRKVVHLKYSEIKRFSHLVIRMEAFNRHTCAYLDFYNVKDRSVDMAQRIETEGKLFYNLTFPLDWKLARMLAWKVNVQLIGNCSKHFNSLGIFQHGNFSEYFYLKNETVRIRFSDWEVSSAHVALYLEPSCKYTVTTRLALLETMGQFFRTYVRLLPSFFASIVLMTLFYQRSASEWENFHMILLKNATNLTFIPGTLISVLLLLVPSDWPQMMDISEYSFALPMLLYFVAYVAVFLVATVGYYAIIGCGQAFHGLFVKFILQRLITRWPNSRILRHISDPFTSLAFDLTFSKFPITVAVFLIALAMGTCGALGLGVTLIFLLFKLFKMYEDLLDDIWRMQIDVDFFQRLSPINFQFSCAMLYFVIASINLPSLVHWVKNFRYGPTPQWDLSLYLCLMLLPTIAILWQQSAPKFNPTLWNAHRYVFYLMGLCVVIWGTHRLYIIGFIITIVLMTLATIQLLSVSLASCEPVAAESPYATTVLSNDPGSPSPEDANKSAASLENATQPPNPKRSFATWKDSLEDSTSDDEMPSLEEADENSDDDNEEREDEEAEIELEDIQNNTDQ